MNLHTLAICLPLLLSSPADAFQAARFDWLAQRGWSYARLRDEGCLPVATRWEVEASGVVPGVPLAVATWAVSAGRHSYVLRQTASQGGRIVAAAEYGVTNYDCAAERWRELPGELRRAIGDVPRGTDEVAERSER